MRCVLLLIALSVCGVASCEDSPSSFAAFGLPGGEAADAAASRDAEADTTSAADASTGGQQDASTSEDVEADAAPPAAASMLLLAGQSNMEGNVDATLLTDLLAELGDDAADTLQARLEATLTTWYQTYDDGYAMYGYSEEMVTLQAAELVRLRDAGLVTAGLSQPLDSILCAQNDAVPAPLAPGCGSPVGPELVLGHALAETDLAPTSLIKVARGGTSLLTDWLSPSAAQAAGTNTGPWYETLQARIASLESAPGSVHPRCETEACEWGAFIWFQGENDSFDEPNATGYASRLEALIADVRSDVGDPSLPVVIVEIGAWAQSMDFGSEVVAAQRAVAASDADAELVVTEDLSGFYHYDPAAQFIIGERIARALDRLLR